MNTQEEIWKDIPNYEGIYQISNFGNLKSLDKWRNHSRNPSKKYLKQGFIMKQTIARGYKYVSLYKNREVKMFLVHQLMAITFLNHKPNGFKYVVDHIDNNGCNNNLNNLQLLTNRANVSKGKKGGTSKYTGVCWNKRDNIWMAYIQINGKRKHLGYFDDEYKAHLAYQEELNKLKI